MRELVVIALIAFVLDLLIGDPAYGLHPIRLVGRWIGALEKGLRRFGLDGSSGGCVLAAVTIGSAVGVFLPVSALAQRLHPWAAHLFHLYVIYSCLALGDLFRHVRPVVQSLEENDLKGARLALSRVVGRDAELLDRWGIGRAAVETLAENFVDGFLSPLFWLTVGGAAAASMGLPVVPAAASAVLSFKCVSTLDSMVGYRTARYARFGRAGARLDDVMNFLPARLSLFILFAGASFSRSHPLEGLRVAARDRLEHDSPNAGHAESFTAGALGVRLGGPVSYEGARKDKPWLGNGSPEVGPRHVRTTVTLLHRSSWIAMLVLMPPLFIW